MNIKIMATITTLTLALLACGDSETSFYVEPPKATQIDGEISLSFDAFTVIFDDLELGTTRSVTLIATSTGDVDAIIYSGSVLTNPGLTFYVQESAMEDITLVPGDSVPLTITATMSKPGVVEGIIRLSTNATESPLVDIALLAWTEGELPTTTTETGL